MKNIINRSTFELSHERRATFNMGELVPTLVMEVLPGDTISCKTSQIARLQALESPYMDRVDIKTYYFYVPNRIIFTNFEKFLTHGEHGEDDDITHPYITSPAVTGFPKNSLGDYLGLPIGIPNINVNALPFRAYALIKNEWFRHEDLTDPVALSKGDGLDIVTSITLQKKPWEKTILHLVYHAPKKETLYIFLWVQLHLLLPQVVHLCQVDKYLCLSAKQQMEQNH